MPTPDPHRLEAFRIGETAAPLVPSAPSRGWMDRFPDRHPYRCLPLAIANAHGWDLLCPAAIEVCWNGGDGVDALRVRPLEPFPPGFPFDHFVTSNFSRGILTFHTGYMFRTPSGWNLMATGPLNQPKAGVAALTGVVETDWLPYPFTMNYQLMEPGTVVFEKGEVFCTIMPVPKNYLDSWDVALHRLEDDPVLRAEEHAFRTERQEFTRRLKAGDQAAIKQGWQRHYFTGRHPDGTRVDGHAHRLRLAEPVERAGTRPRYAKHQSVSATVNAQIEQSRHDHACPWLGHAERRWMAHSVLEQLPLRQNERNFRGRLAMGQAALLPPASVDQLWSEGLIAEPDFLSAEECAVLEAAVEQLRAEQHRDDIEDPFWRDRILFFADLARHAPAAADIMRRAQARVVATIRERYHLTAPIVADTVQLVEWRTGMYMSPHADRAYSDGSPHQMAFRDFASIIYVNSDFTGGDVFFTASNQRVRPQRGMLLAFTAGWAHEHGVLPVTKGVRITMPAFYTFDQERADRSLA